MRFIVIALSLTFIALAFKETGKKGKILLSVLTSAMFISFFLSPTYFVQQLLLVCIMILGLGSFLYLRWIGFHFIR